jgi:hypothetical protein
VKRAPSKRTCNTKTREITKASAIATTGCKCGTLQKVFLTNPVLETCRLRQARKQTGVRTTTVKRSCTHKIPLITSLTQVSMITKQVRVEPVKRYGSKYHKGFTASAGEKRVIRLRRKSSPTMLLKKLKKALGQ